MTKEFDGQGNFEREGAREKYNKQLEALARRVLNENKSDELLLILLDPQDPVWSDLSGSLISEQELIKLRKKSVWIPGMVDKIYSEFISMKVPETKQAFEETLFENSVRLAVLGAGGASVYQVRPR